MTRLNPIWNDQNITLRSKVRLMRTLVISILLYACETWMLPAPLNISYIDHTTNTIACNKIQTDIGPYEDILTTVEKRSYDGSDMWSDQLASAKRSYKAQYQGNENGEGKRKDGKITSKSGPVSISKSVIEQPKTVRDDSRLSPMSIVVPLRLWWLRDTGNR